MAVAHGELRRKKEAMDILVGQDVPLPIAIVLFITFQIQMFSNSNSNVVTITIQPFLTTFLYSYSMFLYS